MSLLIDLKNFIGNFSLEEVNPKVKKLFRVCLLSFTFIHTLTILAYKKWLLSPEGISLSLEMAPKAQGLNLFSLLSMESVRPFVGVFFFFQIVSIILAMRGKFSIITNFLVLFFTLNLNTLIQPILDGGNQVSVILLFFNCFLKTSQNNEKKASFINEIRTSLSNGAFYIIKAHIIFLYITAAVSKLNGPLWKSGMSLYYILQSNEFGHPLIFNNIHVLEMPLTFLTYFTLLFQVCLPFLIHHKLMRLPMIFVGVLLHLGIVFTMGLFHFGTFMALVYVIFLKDKEITFLQKLPNKIFKRGIYEN